MLEGIGSIKMYDNAEVEAYQSSALLPLLIRKSMKNYMRLIITIREM